MNNSNIDTMIVNMKKISKNNQMQLKKRFNRKLRIKEKKHKPEQPKENKYDVL